MSRISCVYAGIVNQLPYIGYSNDFERRKRYHLNNAKNNRSGHFYNAIRKHGEPYWIILQEASEDYLPELEKWWIKFYNTYKGPGYNMTPGGEVGMYGEDHPKPMLGKKHSKETRNKMSEKSSGENNVNFGKKASKETRKKMSDAKQGEKHNRGMLGKKHSEETKKIISEKGKGRVVSEETKEKLRIANTGENSPRGFLGKKHSEESNRKRSESLKATWARKKLEKEGGEIDGL